jgi:hypothetical protein
MCRLLRLRCLLLFFCTVCTLSIYSQYDYVVIDSIQISGNKRTHNHVIYQEMWLKYGDTVPLARLQDLLHADEKRLQSIGLFTDAKLNISRWLEDRVTLKIVVQENIHIYPYVIFELADRNFNVWRKEFNYDFDRTNYGLAITHLNTTGNKDKLKLKFQRGYVRKYELYYDYPYIWKNWGASVNFLYTENKEIGYRTVADKLIFYKASDERVVFKQYRASTTITHRTSAYLSQLLRGEYLHFYVDGRIATDLNPNFLGEGRGRMKMKLLYYNLVWDRTIYPLYPIGGYRLDFQVRKEGLTRSDGVDNTWASLDIEHHKAWRRERWILSNRIKARLHFQNNQIPYYIYSALGYSRDFISGYQLNVIDGRNYFLSKNAFKFRIFQRDFTPKFWMPRQFKIFNIKLFTRCNLDYAYVQDPYYATPNTLVNDHIYGWGPGIDLIFFNNFTLSVDYQIQKNGSRGFFVDSGFNF